MSLPYFPMYPADFEAKTSHLSIAEDGAYNRLLRICWMTPGCSIPVDEDWIMRRVRAHSDEEKEAVRSVLNEFFKAKGGRFSNARLTKEFNAAHEAHEKRKNAGSKGGRTKALKTNKATSSNAVAKPKQPEPEPEPYKKKEPNGSLQKKACRLSEDWVLPKALGEWALEQGMSREDIRREADKFRDYWVSVSGQKGVKRDWSATWRNWIRRRLEDQTSRSGSDGSGSFWFGNEVHT